MAMKQAVTPESARTRLAKIKEGIQKTRKGASTTPSRKTPAKKTERSLTKTEGNPPDVVVQSSRVAAIEKLLPFYEYELPKDWGKPITGKGKGKVGGRPSVITDKVLRKLEYAFAYDMTNEEACIMAGIYPSTLYAFLKDQPKFSETIALLRHIPVFLARQTFVNAVISDPEKAVRYLERKMKAEFSPKLELGVGGNVTHTHTIDEGSQRTVDTLFQLFERKARMVHEHAVVIEDDSELDALGTGGGLDA